jgi:hypothetical protein
VPPPALPLFVFPAHLPGQASDTGRNAEREGAMRHIVRHEDWATVDLDTTARHVLVRQDWLYVWSFGKKGHRWTPEEKHSFHREVDRTIWAHWSQRMRIRARVNLATPRLPNDALRWHLAGLDLTLSFDVRQVVVGGQWKVFVAQEDPHIEEKPRARVDFGPKEIHLYSTDLLVQRARRFTGDTPKEGFSVHAHEFGHAIGNSDDEYQESSEFFQDTDSVMNIGQQLRPRHLELVCRTLAKMVKGCTFVAHQRPPL